MARIKRNYTTDAQIIEFSARGLRFLCAVGSYPERRFVSYIADGADLVKPGGKFVALINWGMCVKLEEPYEDEDYPAEQIAEAIENSTYMNFPQDPDEQWELACEIAEAIEPYLKGGEKNEQA